MDFAFQDSNEDPFQYIKRVANDFEEWLEKCKKYFCTRLKRIGLQRALGIGLEPRPTGGELIPLDEDDEARRLRRLRNKEYIRRFQLYHNPPLWSKRWWWRLPGRLISLPFQLCKTLVEAAAVAAWKGHLFKLSV